MTLNPASARAALVLEISVDFPTPPLPYIRMCSVMGCSDSDKKRPGTPISGGVISPASGVSGQLVIFDGAADG
jgi:hypothetical protein